MGQMIPLIVSLLKVIELNTPGVIDVISQLLLLMEETG